MLHTKDFSLNCHFMCFSILEKEESVLVALLNMLILNTMLRCNFCQVLLYDILTTIRSRQNNYLVLFVKIISSHLPTNAIHAIFYICYCSCIGITSNMTCSCTNHVDNQFQIETTFSKLSYKIWIESVDLGN